MREREREKEGERVTHTEGLANGGARLHYHAGAVFITLTFPNVARFIRCSRVETLRYVRSRTHARVDPCVREETGKEREDIYCECACIASAMSLNLHNKTSCGRTPRCRRRPRRPALSPHRSRPCRAIFEAAGTRCGAQLQRSPVIE